jgi:transposase-like protein
MEVVMREELPQFLGAEYGECSPERRGYRNGSYTRDLATSCGKIEDLEVRRRSYGTIPGSALVSIVESKDTNEAVDAV